DVIADGQDGVLVKFGDVPALAAAVGELLRDRERARRLGAAGQAKVLRELTWDRIYAQVRAVYDEVVKT
ncbi:MAG TPA: glycosyltransferase, partial [Roseiflexaceae bacterium]|nr:glycosyltransferase [Roseiflexaceae bacterium]